MIGISCSKSSSTWNKLQEMIVGKGRLSIYIYNFKNNPRPLDSSYCQYTHTSNVWIK